MIFGITKLGPVIIGSKPIHLFSFSDKNKDSLKSIQIINSHFRYCKKIKYEIFRCKNKSLKMLLYNPLALAAMLQKRENSDFLESLGYPQSQSIDPYLCHLIKKMIQCESHHEIGLFFGYPLKDVRGFMGMTRLRLTKTNGWQIYGNPDESEKKFAEYKSDERIFQQFVESNGLNSALLYA